MDGLRKWGINEKLDKFKEEFDLLDVDGNGSISADELKQIMVTVDDTVSDENIKDMMDDADLNTDGVIDFQEFGKMMRQLLKENLLDEFQRYDKDANGTVSVSELTQVLHKFCIVISDDNLNGMITETDQCGDGRINFEKFMSLMINK